LDKKITEAHGVASRLLLLPLADASGDSSKKKIIYARVSG
jgi:hypothetical protein